MRRDGRTHEPGGWSSVGSMKQAASLPNKMFDVSQNWICFSSRIFHTLIANEAATEREKWDLVFKIVAKMHHTGLERKRDERWKRTFEQMMNFLIPVQNNYNWWCLECGYCMCDMRCYPHYRGHISCEVVTIVIARLRLAAGGTERDPAVSQDSHRVKAAPPGPGPAENNHNKT